MNIYSLLRFLVIATNLQVENKAALETLHQAKAIALDLVDKLEELNAFGTIASITSGELSE